MSARLISRPTFASVEAICSNQSTSPLQESGKTSTTVGHNHFGSSSVDLSDEITRGVSIVIPSETYNRIRRSMEMPSEVHFREVLSPRVHLDSDAECHRSHQQKKPNARATSSWSSGRSTEEEKAAEARLKLARFREEQEAEIRRLNEMIIEAKCLAAREAQVEEKRRQKEESSRMPEGLPMDVDRKTEEEFRAKRAAINQSYAGMIRQQIEANEALRANADRTMRDWEAQLIERRMDRFSRDEAEERIKKLERQRQLKEGLEECMAERQRLLEKQKMDEANIRHKMEQYATTRMAWMKSLQEVEAKRVAVRLRQEATNFDRFRDDSSAYERSRAVQNRRVRESLDRDWRTAELQAEAARREARQKLTEAREEQIAWKRQAAKEEAANQLQEHNRLVELSRKETEADRDAEMRRRMQALEYGDEVRRQIREKEDRSRLERYERQREAALTKAAEAIHDEKILKIKVKKLQELRSEEIPNKYVMNIARKSRVPWAILN